MSTGGVHLSPREHEVARMIGRGYGYEAIAVRLGVRATTIRVHVAHIADKLPNPEHLRPYALVLLWITRNQWVA